MKGYRSEQTELSRRIRNLRTNAGLRQQDVGAILNLQRQSYGNYETGKRNPNIAVLQKLSQFYGVPMDYFTCDENQATEICKHLEKHPQIPEHSDTKPDQM